MAGLNKVSLIGRLGKDPEKKYTPGGTAVANLSLATDESYKDKDGNKIDRVEWHRVVCWGKLGDLVSSYLKKGSQAYVEGKLQTRKWQDKQGQDRYTTEIVGQNVIFLDSRGSGGNGQQGDGNDPGYGEPPAGLDEVPF